MDFLAIIDDYSWDGCIYLLSHHSEALTYFNQFVAEIQNQIDRKIKILNTKHGVNICLISSENYVKRMK